MSLNKKKELIATASIAISIALGTTVGFGFEPSAGELDLRSLPGSKFWSDSVIIYFERGQDELAGDIKGTKPIGLLYNNASELTISPVLPQLSCPVRIGDNKNLVTINLEINCKVNSGRQSVKRGYTLDLYLLDKNGRKLTRLRMLEDLKIYTEQIKTLKIQKTVDASIWHNFWRSTAGAALVVNRDLMTQEEIQEEEDYFEWRRTIDAAGREASIKSARGQTRRQSYDLCLRRAKVGARKNGYTSTVDTAYFIKAFMHQWQYSYGQNDLALKTIVFSNFNPASDGYDLYANPIPQ
jgi:hypothetical protein